MNKTSPTSCSASWLLGAARFAILLGGASCADDANRAGRPAHGQASAASTSAPATPATGAPQTAIVHGRAFSLQVLRGQSGKRASMSLQVAGDQLVMTFGSWRTDCAYSVLEGAIKFCDQYTIAITETERRYVVNGKQVDLLPNAAYAFSQDGEYARIR